MWVLKSLDFALLKFFLQAQGLSCPGADPSVHSQERVRACIISRFFLCSIRFADSQDCPSVRCTVISCHLIGIPLVIIRESGASCPVTIWVCLFP